MEKILSEVKKIYLVGIGGVGMSGLAILLKESGFIVEGSDMKRGSNVSLLEKEGINVFLGHKKEHINCGIDLICYSSAVKEDNPEIAEAKARGIRIVKRGQLLAQLTRDKKTIAVAGSHGKTTTTSLLSYLLTSLGYKPTVFLGGLPLNYSRGAWLGGDYFVSETDESDGSFLYYEPWVSIITNVDNEHLDYYGDFNNLKKSFLQFACQTKEKVFGWGDHPYLRELISESGGVSFGWGTHNLVRGSNFRFDGKFSCFDVYIKDKFVTSVNAPLLGEHNCLNILGAFAFFFYLGEDLAKISRLLVDFKGTKRRFQIKAVIDGITFVDDYAHHPTEIKAVLKSARLLNPKRVFLILQPHRFSRVKLMKEQFSRCVLEADYAVITDIYGASEKNSDNFNGEDIFKETIKSFSDRVIYLPEGMLTEKIPFYLRPGDLVLALGAGNINILMEKVVDEFRKNRVKA